MNYKNYQEDWAVYLTTINNTQVGSILVDLGISSIAPIESKSFLTVVTTFMNHPTEDGLSSEEETDILNQIEDDLIESISSKNSAIYAGRLKFNGKIKSFFYSENVGEIEGDILAITDKYKDYRFESEFGEEKDWETYFEILYPLPIQMQIIKNGLVLENLQKHGDNLEKERQVDHWIYFKTESDRENFLDAISNKGFEIVTKDKVNNENAPFSLQLARIDKVDYQSIDEYTIFLWEKAQEFNGDYDGWETFIVSD